MAEYTSNLNLKQPDGDEEALIYDINDNMTKIDAFAGKVNPRKTNITSLASDSTILGLENGIYQINLSANSEYLPERWGTLEVNHSNVTYGVAIFVSTGGNVYTRHMNGISAWHNSWTQLALNSQLTLNNVTNFQVIQDSGHNLLILRGNYEGTNNFLQIIHNANTKQMQIAKAVGGTESVLATFIDETAINSQLTTIVDNSLTAGTGVTINMQRKLKIGKLVTYNLVITTSAQTQADTSLVTGFEPHNGGYNGVPTIVSYNNSSATAFFYLHDNNDLRPISAFGAGTWRMSLSYICS